MGVREGKQDKGGILPFGNTELIDGAVGVEFKVVKLVV